MKFGLIRRRRNGNCRKIPIRIHDYFGKKRQGT
jgi:hypothetical protein